MALVTPILYPVAAFDATQAYTFRFSVSGGDQVAANRLIIKNNDTLVEVYNQQITTFAFEHTVPVNTLTNGVYYQATLITYNAAGEQSTASSPIQFYCYSAPTLVLSNLPSGGIVENSSFAFEAVYNQAEGELLNGYSFTLYDAQGVQIASSGAQYVGSTEAPPTTVGYTFTGLLDKTSYYIQAFGQTINGTSVESAKTPITIRYSRPDASVLIELVNNCQDGYVSITSNFVEIEGTVDPEPAIYVKDNTAIDLRAANANVDFLEGYSVIGDFTAQIWGYDFNENTNILRFATAVDGSNLYINYRVDYEDETKVYADCDIISSGVHYYIYTPSIPNPAADDKVNIWLRRIGGIYGIEIHNLGQ